MRTARLLTVSCSTREGGLPNPLDADPLQDADPLGNVTCAACWKANLSPVNRMTDRQV